MSSLHTSTHPSAVHSCMPGDQVSSFAHEHPSICCAFMHAQNTPSPPCVTHPHTQMSCSTGEVVQKAQVFGHDEQHNMLILKEVRSFTAGLTRGASVGVFSTSECRLADALTLCIRARSTGMRYNMHT